MTHSRHVLVTGASGYVGGSLLPQLRDAGHRVRALARTPEKLDLDADVQVVKGDVVSGDGLDDALKDIETAFYLVHSMGRGSGKDFHDRDRTGARRFGEAASRAGVERVVYLGGLGPTGPDASEHLRSRHEVAEILRSSGPPLTYVRAAMVIGAESASFRMMSSLVKRLPFMVCPRWIDTRSQPVAIRDVTGTLRELAGREEAPEEVQLGGADVLTYREMMTRCAQVLGRRPPKIVRVPVLSPRLSSYWVSLVTPVETGLVQPLVEGLTAEMVVEQPPADGLNADPMGFDAAVRAAVSEGL